MGPDSETCIVNKTCTGVVHFLDTAPDSGVSFKWLIVYLT